MKVEELRDKDSVGAFAEYVSVVEAKNMELIPEQYHEIFPEVCAECGSDMIISKTLTKIMCCDPRCWIKLAYALEEVLKNFGAKDVGIGTCRSIMKAAYPFLKYKSHLEVLVMEDKYIQNAVGDMAFYNFKLAVEQVKKAQMTFPQMVSKLSIPGFNTTALKAFDGMSSVKDLITSLKRLGNADLFLESRGIYDKMKIFNLFEYLPDISLAEAEVFNVILPLASTEVDIVITGNLMPKGIKITKDKFVELCNSIGTIKPGVRLFDIRQTTAIQSTHYLIADYPSTTNKYLSVKAREESEGRKLIYTSEEFIEYLKGVVACVMGDKEISN